MKEVQKKKTFPRSLTVEDLFYQIHGLLQTLTQRTSHITSKQRLIETAGKMHGHVFKLMTQCQANIHHKEWGWCTLVKFVHCKTNGEGCPACSKKCKFGNKGFNWFVFSLCLSFPALSKHINIHSHHLAAWRHGILCIFTFYFTSLMV